MRQKNTNGIILQQAILPSMGQRLSEAAVISLTDHSIILLERMYEVNGVKTNYLSQLYMKCQRSAVTEEQIKHRDESGGTGKSKILPDEDVERKMEIKNIIYQELEENGNLRVDAVKEKIFHSNEEMKRDFDEKVENTTFKMMK